MKKLIIVFSILFLLILLVPIIYFGIYKQSITPEIGILCQKDFNCPERKYGDTICNGKRLYQEFLEYSCINGICQPIQNEELVEDCEYKCDLIPNVLAQSNIISNETNQSLKLPKSAFGCIPKNCDEMIMQCSGNSISICENNELKTKEYCEYGCLDSQCLPKPTNYIIYILIGLIIFILIAISLIIFISVKLSKKKKRKK